MKSTLGVLCALLASGHVGAAAPRPVGTNCSAALPPASAGEEGGHGFVLKVFPRTGDIGGHYSGCQAVFAMSRDGEVRLAWLIEIKSGEPVRMWSADEDMKDVLQCRYKNRSLVRGNPDVCPRGESLLMPTRPAGCFTATPEPDQCQYDVN